MTLKLRKLPPSKELLEELNSDGQSTQELARRFHVTPKTITKWYQLYGIERYKTKELLRRYLGASEERLKQLLDGGHSIAQLAEHFEVSYNTAMGWLRHLGIRPPSAIAAGSKTLRTSPTRAQLEGCTRDRLTRKEISKRFKISARALSRLYKEYGIDSYRSNRRFKEGSKHITRELLESFDRRGLSISEATRELGLQSPNTTRAWYVRLGIERPSQLELNAIKRGLSPERLQEIISTARSPQQLFEDLRLSSRAMLYRWLKKLPQIEKGEG